MALVECNDCKGNVSDRADACPACGRPRERSRIESAREYLSSIPPLLAEAGILVYVFGYIIGEPSLGRWRSNLVAAMLLGASGSFHFLIHAIHGRKRRRAVAFALLAMFWLGMVDVVLWRLVK